MRKKRWKAMKKEIDFPRRKNAEITMTSQEIRNEVEKVI